MSRLVWQMSCPSNEKDVLKVYRCLQSFLIWPLVILSLLKLLSSSGFGLKEIKSLPCEDGKIAKNSVTVDRIGNFRDTETARSGIKRKENMVIP